jgi:AcrR family transcriptional regulator
MPQSQRTRRDPRREATRVALIEAAESMFAQAGVEGVSNREIGHAIGSLHKNVIAYYFGSKEALIEAIYRYRLPYLDQRRAELLAKADAVGQGHDVAALMDIAWRPLFEQTNAEGKHSFAGFLSQLAGWAWTRSAQNPEYPETNKVAARLRKCLPSEIDARFDARMQLIAGMIFVTLQLIDREQYGRQAAEKAFVEAVDMASAALITPART